MPWTTPKTWATNDLVTAADLNLHLRDNLAVLKSPPGQIIELTTNFTLTGGWIDVPGATVTFTPSGGDVYVSFTATYRRVNTYDGTITLDININGTRFGGGQTGLVWNALDLTERAILLSCWVPSSRLNTGVANTIKLVYGNGYSGAQRYAEFMCSTHKVQFAVREVS